MKDLDFESRSAAPRLAEAAATPAAATAAAAAPHAGRQGGRVPLEACDPLTDPSVLASLLEAAPDAIFVKDLAGRYVVVNQACARAVGLPAEQIIGRTARDLFGTEDAATLIALEREVLLCGETRTFEGPFAAGRNPRTYVVTVSPWRCGDDVCGWIGVCRETTSAWASERALARSASLLAAALEATADGVLVCDSAGRIVSFNRKFAEMWRIPESILAQGDDSRVVLFVRDQLADPAAFESRIRDLYERPSAETFDLLVFRDGRVYERHTKPQILDGQSVGRVSSFRDVTQRHHTEQALRVSEARYRELFENANDIVYTHDLEGRFLEVNRRGVEISGYSPVEILDLNIRDVLAPEQLDRVAANLARGVAGGIMPVVELDLLTKHGARIPLEVNARILREGGVPVAVQGIARDVTERREAENALAAQAYLEAALARVGRELIGALAGSEVLQRLCELVTEVLLTDGSTSLLFSPDGTTFAPVAIAGRTVEQQEVMRTLRMRTSWVQSQLDRFDLSPVMTGSSKDLAAPGKELVESFGVESWLAMALRRGKQIIGVQIAGRGPGAPPFSARDERLAAGIAQLASLALENARLVEELERASGLKSEFVTTMSHELRTPLNIIIGYQDLLAEGTFGSLEGQQADIVARLQLRSRELLDLIDATLDLGRIEGGRLRLQLAEVALAEILEEIDAETRELRHGRPVELAWRVPDVVAPLQSDRTKLKVVLKNLVVNALKFTERGSIEIAATQDARGTEISVRDTGIGIDPGALGLIFEPFRQVDSSSTRRHGGVGLGLHIVRRLCDMLGGSVQVESRLGEGSCFRIWLPAQPAAR